MPLSVADGFRSAVGTAFAQTCVRTATVPNPLLTRRDHPRLADPHVEQRSRDAPRRGDALQFGADIVRPDNVIAAECFPQELESTLQRVFQATRLR